MLTTIGDADERGISVPFFSPSGKVFIEGPDENSVNFIIIEPGHYQLTAAQKANYENETLSIRLYFKKVEIPVIKSEILVRDEQLNPPQQLLETTDVAGF